MSAVIEDTSEYAGVIYYLHDGDYVPRYIGQTTGPLRKRFYAHKSEAKRGVDRPVYRWMRKHGIENVQVCTLELLEEKDLEWLDSREEFYIAMYRCPTARVNLNLADGGSVPSRGATRSVETRAKISAARSGRKLSDEHRAAISRGLMGNQYRAGKPNPDGIARMAEANRGKPRPEHVKEAIRKAHTGKNVSEESRAKMSAAQLASPHKGRSNHNRWHINRNIVKPGCTFCEEVEANG